MEFKPWPKIKRDNPYGVTITEKIDGTNACIVIKDGEIAAVQSRKRFIGIDSDNYGFAGWVYANEEALLGLGDGHHFGEWAGEGIQKNPLKMEGKHFFLFNTRRWNPDNPNLPECCSVVPVLFEGGLKPGKVDELLTDMKEDDSVIHEGLVVFYHAFDMMTKHTIKEPKGKWRSQ